MRIGRAVPLLAAALAVGAAAANAPVPPPFKEGVNYASVMPAQPVSVNPGQIEVTEFFWYGDPHSYALENALDTWQKTAPTNVVVVRVPAALNPQWDVAARAYYTAVQLGLAQAAQTAIFQAVHANQLNPGTQADFETLFQTRLGVNAARFRQVWNSYAVDVELSQAKVQAQRYGITQVPMLAVNGEWLTGTGYRLNDAQLMALVNWLVQQEETALPAAVQ